MILLPKALVGPMLMLACELFASDVPRGYVAVAHAHEVPPAILYALACAESGRRLSNGQIRPWPWALNIAGQSRYYATRAEAHQDLTAALSTNSNIDIGLGQINWSWHRARLETPWQALDPYFNLHRMAEIFREQFEACHCDDWWVAVERYHAPSDTPGAQARRLHYRENVHQCWATISDPISDSNTESVSLAR